MKIKTASVLITFLLFLAVSIHPAPIIYGIAAKNTCLHSHPVKGSACVVFVPSGGQVMLGQKHVNGFYSARYGNVFGWVYEKRVSIVFPTE